MDEIAQWPLSKIKEYLAFWLTEKEDFKEKMKEESMTDEERAQAIMNILNKTGRGQK